MSVEMGQKPEPRQLAIASPRVGRVRLQMSSHLHHDALLMRPLVLHSSGRSRENSHRRVLHIEYAGFPLPEPLQWHDAA